MAQRKAKNGEAAAEAEETVTSEVEVGAKQGEKASGKAAKKKPAKKTAAKAKPAGKAAKKAKAPAKAKKPAKGKKALAEVDADADEAGDDEGAEAAPKKTGGRGKYLVIVESPAKAKTIKKYLGSGYTVKASVGHVKDLPRSKIGVDIDKGFKPVYETVRGKEKVLAEIKKHAQNAEKVFLATDPDREGEAIAWHINEELGHKDTQRVLFNEITKKAVQEAIEHPRQINQETFESQQARRILDRLVGYQISPILWNKVRRGLSAGRVQSVAVRQIVEREEAIKAFVPEEYWTIDASLEGAQPPPFKARLTKFKGEKAEVKDKTLADEIVADVEGKDFTVVKVDKRERRRNAPAPFITSKLQQEAANRLHFTAKKTMTLAQRLYEGVELGEMGQTALITYMRTDSTRLSNDAVEQARGLVREKWGPDYLPEEPNVFKTKKSAQDAHEAIRPVSTEFPPERLKQYVLEGEGRGALEPDMLRLYELIWNRFVACQMKPAVYDQTSAEITAGQAGFRASGSTLKFPGYLAVYGATLTVDEEAEREKAAKEGSEDATDESPWQLPVLTEGEKLKLDKILPEQHFTQPPPRFTEASLVKELEEKGIGRPSTYAAILSTIQDKGYVEKREGRFYPTRLGEITTGELVKHFPTEMDVQFTAGMEEKLDAIAEGTIDWKKMLREFHDPFAETLKRAAVEMRDVKRMEIPTDIVCDKCGKPMVRKWGKLDEFLACTGYPECKKTQDFKEVDGKIVPVPDVFTDEKCDKCGLPMLVKRGRFGLFLACSGYPDCKGTKPMSIGVGCPECKIGYLTERRSRFGKVFFSCHRYPDCKFAAWDRPIAESCPDCKAPYLVQKFSKRDGAYIACPQKCGYRREVVPTPEAPAPGNGATPTA